MTEKHRQRTPTDCMTICQSFSRERNWQLIILKNCNQASGIWPCTSILCELMRFSNLLSCAFWHNLIHNISNTNAHSTWITIAIQDTPLWISCWRFSFAELYCSRIPKRELYTFKFLINKISAPFICLLPAGKLRQFLNKSFVSTCALLSNNFL